MNAGARQRDRSVGGGADGLDGRPALSSASQWSSSSQPQARQAPAAGSGPASHTVHGSNRTSAVCSPTNTLLNSKLVIRGYPAGCIRLADCRSEDTPPRAWQADAVKIGTSLRSTYPVDDPRQGARWMVERAAAAAAAGLDSLFVGDHHATGPAAYYQNSPILGRLLAEWGDRPAGALYLLPAWNPILVAEQVGTLAAVAEGPFVLQCAVGGGDQMAAMGAPPKGRGAVFEHHLDVIRRLLAGEEVDGVRVAPDPAGAARGVDRRARPGGHRPGRPDGRRAGSPPPGPPTSRRPNWPPPTARPARPTTARRRRWSSGATSTSAATRPTPAGSPRPVLDGGYRGMDPSATVVGSPEQVAERFAGYAAMGYDHVLVRHLAEDQDEVLASFARLREVRERVAGL